MRLSTDEFNTEPLDVCLEALLEEAQACDEENNQTARRILDVDAAISGLDALREQIEEEGASRQVALEMASIDENIHGDFYPVNSYTAEPSHINQSVALESIGGTIADMVKRIFKEILKAIEAVANFFKRMGRYIVRFYREIIGGKSATTAKTNAKQATSQGNVHASAKAADVVRGKGVIDDDKLRRLKSYDPKLQRIIDVFRKEYAVFYDAGKLAGFEGLWKTLFVELDTNLWGLAQRHESVMDALKNPSAPVSNEVQESWDRIKATGPTPQFVYEFTRLIPPEYMEFSEPRTLAGCYGYCSEIMDLTLARSPNGVDPTAAGDYSIEWYLNFITRAELPDFDVVDEYYQRAGEITNMVDEMRDQVNQIINGPKRWDHIAVHDVTALINNVRDVMDGFRIHFQTHLVISRTLLKVWHSINVLNKQYVEYCEVIDDILAEVGVA